MNSSPKDTFSDDGSNRSGVYGKGGARGRGRGGCGGRGHTYETKADDSQKDNLTFVRLETLQPWEDHPPAKRLHGMFARRKEKVLRETCRRFCARQTIQIRAFSDICHSSSICNAQGRNDPETWRLKYFICTFCLRSFPVDVCDGLATHTEIDSFDDGSDESKHSLSRHSTGRRS